MNQDITFVWLVVEQYKCQNVAWMVKYVTARKAVNDLLADGF